MKQRKTSSIEVPQIDKFRQAARELDADQSEEAFDRAPTKIAKASSENARSLRKAKAETCPPPIANILRICFSPSIIEGG